VVGLREAVGLGTADRLLATATPSDEAALWECLVALVAGAELVLSDTPDGLRTLVERHTPTVVFAAAHEVSALSGVDAPGLRVVCVDAEPPRPSPMSATPLFLPGALGVPPHSVWTPDGRGRWHGRPARGAVLEVLDRFGHPVEPGVPGHLHLDRREPTGILVRRLVDGSLQWLGPVDPPPAASALDDTPYVPPRTATEEVVATIWGELVDAERVGVNDDFFRLGGHSLLAMQAISRLTTVFQVEVPVRALFEDPTVAGLADVLTGLERRPGQVEQIAGIWLRVRADAAGATGGRSADVH
jgi:hypothetical protein